MSGVFSEGFPARTFVVLHHVGPGSREALVGLSAQKEGVGGGQLVELELLLFFAPEWGFPARVFHHPVQRHELRYDYLSHSCLLHSILHLVSFHQVVFDDIARQGGTASTER
jgi:hypothetical protein